MAHRPANKELRFAADMATSLYKAWRHNNESHGVSSRGHANDMKYECVRFVAKTFCDNIDTDAIQDLMDRSRSRRVIGVGSSFTWASWKSRHK